MRQEVMDHENESATGDANGKATNDAKGKETTPQTRFANGTEPCARLADGLWRGLCLCARYL
jgi:hypothetical protein